MVLSREDVERLVLTKRLIAPFAKPQMGPSSYDLTIGDEYYVYNDSDGERFLPRKLAATEPEDRFSIPPNGCAFILTAEVLNMPVNVAGQISLRFGLTKRGIMLSPQAPIDPGYSGNVMMMLYNLSDRPQDFRRGDPFVSVSFHELSSPTHAYRGINQGVTSIEGFMPTGLPPVQTSMAREQKKVDDKINEFDRRLDDRLLQFETRLSEMGRASQQKLTTTLAVIALVFTGATLAASLLVLLLTLSVFNAPVGPATDTPTAITSTPGPDASLTVTGGGSAQ